MPLLDSEVFGCWGLVGILTGCYNALMQTDTLAGLNSAQREAAEHVEGPLLIVAGPGSGKTRVITQRIAYLVNVSGVPPHRIAAVTFTNKAAREMRERLGRLLGNNVNYLTCGTFHAFCASILRRDGRDIGVDPNFVIYDSDDQARLIKRALEEANLDPKRHPVRSLLSAISNAKATLLEPVDFAATVHSYYEEIVLRVYERYQSLLAQSSALDFDDLLLKTVRLFQNSPEVIENYRSRYLHLMVDEFQDTNLVQYQMAKLLAGKFRNICVVGDPDQSIYSWRNADLRNILSFQADYPDAKVVNLGENYRSTQNILDAAKGLIAPNTGRLNRDLWTSNPAGDAIVITEAHTEEEEAQLVVREVAALTREKGYLLRDCAVMYRINAQSRSLEEACLRLGVPYRLIGGLRFYQRKEVKDIVAYLRIIQNPYDQISLERIINTPPRAIGQRSIEEVTLWGKARGLPLYAALQAVVSAHLGGESTPLTPRALSAIERFLQLISGLIAAAGDWTVAELLDAVLERVGYRDYLFASDNDRGEEQWENIQELRGQATEIQELVPDSALPAFLEHVALVSNVDGMDDQADALTLITLHQAKGLEYPVVFIVGLEEGLLPHARSMDDPAELEEERRLCYVGITRAQKRLYLFRAFRRRLMGGSLPTVPSRFLADIPPHLIDSSLPLRKTDADWRRTPRVTPSVFTDPNEVDSGSPPFRAGDKVTHPSFGDGIVVNCIAAGSDYEVAVAFTANVGVKRLLLSFANLEKSP